jgi:hypothetical protein
MKMGEDIRMGFRWIRSRPVETMLLIFGISLGIGATSAGIALAGRTAAEARELLSSAQYREIVVQARESADDMEVPAMERTETEMIILTTADLSAAEEAEDVRFAYIANRMDMRLGTFAMPSFGGTAGSQAGGTAGLQTGGAPPGGMEGEGGPPPDMGFPGGENFQDQDVELPEGPQPTVEEIVGYEVSPEFFAAQDMAAAQGSLFTAGDMADNTPLLVLGSTLAKTIYEDGQPLNRQVLSRRQLYTIVGILEPTGTAYDTMAFTPAMMVELSGGGGEAMARMFMRFNTTLHFTVADADRLEQAKAQLTSWFENEYGAGSVVITIPRYAAESARDRNNRLVTVILFLAVSALLIAAANVMNILGSRALRKRRSVGILKALGATWQGVFTLFFLEAGVIGAFGAVLGTGFSALISVLMRQTMGLGGVSVGFLAAGIAGAAILVTALDILPAMQAARVPAAEAIRYE